MCSHCTHVHAHTFSTLHTRVHTWPHNVHSCVHTCIHAYPYTLRTCARTHTWLASEEGQEPALCSRPNSSVSGDLEPDMSKQTLQERAGVREDRTAGAS